MNKMLLIMKLDNINKSYKPRKREIKVLSDLHIEFFSNNFYAIMGHSGSGKSTLINILGLLDSFDSGIYEFYGTRTTNFNDKKASTFLINIHQLVVFSYKKSTIIKT